MNRIRRKLSKVTSHPPQPGLVHFPARRCISADEGRRKHYIYTGTHRLRPGKGLSFN